MIDLPAPKWGQIASGNEPERFTAQPVGDSFVAELRLMCARRVLRAGLGGDTVKGPLTRRRKGGPDLFADPMPERVEPCLALLAPKPPAGEDWAFEVKWDGYRLAVHVERGRVRIITRGGHDWTSRFPTIAHDAHELAVYSAILDGEAVVLDERGASDFGAFQRALGGRGGKQSAASAILYAFDLLYLDGRDLRALPLAERRDMLEALLPTRTSIRLSEEINADGAPFLRLACEMGLEGIIAKRRSAPYRSGRAGDWLKIKCIQSEGFVIIGYEPSAVGQQASGRSRLALRHARDLGAARRRFPEALPLAARQPRTTAAEIRDEVRRLLPRHRPDLSAGLAWADDGQCSSFLGGPQWRPER